MIIKSVLENILAAQKSNLEATAFGLKRNALETLPNLDSHALIVSGIRRCGKSTLLNQLLKEKYPQAIYVNFEDSRLYNFEPNDFSRLDQIVLESGSQALFFDEIQIIPQWERYARQKLDEGYKVVITGSNASLLSRELGTKLTGRHITKELFPFSYSEFCSFNEAVPGQESVNAYLKTGGFPEYVKSGIDEILNHLFDDILIRDIAVRYGVRDIKTLQRLALYLISNVATLITGNRLKGLFEVGSTTTVMDYLSHLEFTYLFYFIPKFSYSARKQLANPRKIYTVDNGMITTNSGSFTEDSGRKLENLVFMHLRRHHQTIFYYAEKGECDFVVVKKGNFHQAIQVCLELTPDNLDRELRGLFEALNEFNAKEGLLITLNQKDRFEKDGKVAHVLPVHEFLMENEN